MFHIWSEWDKTSSEFRLKFESICKQFKSNSNFECVNYEGSNNEIPGNFQVKTFPSLHMVIDRDYMENPIPYTGSADEEAIVSFIKWYLDQKWEDL